MINLKSFAGATDYVHQEKFKGMGFIISLNHGLGYIGVCKKQIDSSCKDIFFIQGDEAGFYIDLSNDGQLLRYLDSAFGL